MKTTEQLFKELGYECQEYKTNIEYYFCDKKSEKWIIFWKQEKQLAISACNLSGKELEAIYRQAYELGWIEC